MKRGTKSKIKCALRNAKLKFKRLSITGHYKSALNKKREINITAALLREASHA